jgi:hypothetical protein
VAGEVKRQVLLEHVDRAVVVGGSGLVELFERGVGARDMRGVVFVMVEFEDLGGVVGFEGRKVVGQLGQGVRRHQRCSGSGIGSTAGEAGSFRAAG